MTKLLLCCLPATLGSGSVGLKSMQAATTVRIVLRTGIALRRSAMPCDGSVTLRGAPALSLDPESALVRERPRRHRRALTRLARARRARAGDVSLVREPLDGAVGLAVEQ